MPAPTYRYIILSGDRVVDVLLPEEGRHRISLAKETDSDEPINKQDAVRKEGGLNTLEWLLSDLDVSIEDVKAPVSVHAHDIHWGLRLVPKHLYSQEPSDPKVYRVVDRHLHAASISDAQLFPTICNKKGVISASLTVIADYVSHIANNDGWRMYTEELAKPDDRQAIRRIIMLPRQMPYAVSRGRWPESSSDLWEAFRTDTGFPHVAQRDTLIITSLDRLRQDGAKISKRISWDKTFQGFVTEIDSFPLLRRLCNFGHVVVRAGVSGAFYCKSQFSERGELLNRKTWLVYDANAKGGIFRDLVSQGNVFGTRSAFAACIADSLYKGENSRTNKSADSFSNSSQYVLEGIRKAITTSQFLYQEGFGDTIAKVRAYPNHFEGKTSQISNTTKASILASAGVR